VKWKKKLEDVQKKILVEREKWEKKLTAEKQRVGRLLVKANDDRQVHHRLMQQQIDKSKEKEEDLQLIITGLEDAKEAAVTERTAAKRETKEAI